MSTPTLTRRPVSTPASAMATAQPNLPRPRVAVRLMAGAASAVVTWVIVSALASYGLPAEDGASLLAAARPTVMK